MQSTMSLIEFNSQCYCIHIELLFLFLYIEVTVEQYFKSIFNMTVIFLSFFRRFLSHPASKFYLWEQDIMVIIVQHSKKLSSTGPVG